MTAGTRMALPASTATTFADITVIAPVRVVRLRETAAAEYPSLCLLTQHQQS